MNVFRFATEQKQREREKQATGNVSRDVQQRMAEINSRLRLKKSLDISDTKSNVSLITSQAAAKQNLARLLRAQSQADLAEMKTFYTSPSSITEISLRASTFRGVDLEYYRRFAETQKQQESLNKYVRKLKQKARLKLTVYAIAGTATVALVGIAIAPELFIAVIGDTATQLGLASYSSSIIEFLLGSADPTVARLQTLGRFVSLLQTSSMALAFINGGPILLLTQFLAYDYRVSQVIRAALPFGPWANVFVMEIVKSTAEGWYNFHVKWKSPETLQNELLYKATLAKLEQEKELESFKRKVLKAGSLQAYIGKQNKLKAKKEQDKTALEDTSQYSERKWRRYLKRLMSRRSIAVLVGTAGICYLLPVYSTVTSLIQWLANVLNHDSPRQFFVETTSIAAQVFLWPYVAKAIAISLFPRARLVGQWLKSKSRYLRTAAQANLLSGNNPLIRPVKSTFEWYYQQEMLWDLSVETVLEWMFQRSTMVAGNIVAQQYLFNFKLVDRMVQQTDWYALRSPLVRLNSSVSEWIRSGDISKLTYENIMKEWRSTQLATTEMRMYNIETGETWTVKDVNYAKAVITLESDKDQVLNLQEAKDRLTVERNWRLVDSEGDRMRIDVDNHLLKAAVSQFEKKLQERSIDVAELPKAVQDQFVKDSEVFRSSKGVIDKMQVEVARVQSEVNRQKTLLATTAVVQQGYKILSGQNEYGAGPWYRSFLFGKEYNAFIQEYYQDAKSLLQSQLSAVDWEKLSKTVADFGVKCAGISNPIGQAGEQSRRQGICEGDRMSLVSLFREMTEKAAGTAEQRMKETADLIQKTQTFLDEATAKVIERQQSLDKLMDDYLSNLSRAQALIPTSAWDLSASFAEIKDYTGGRDRVLQGVEQEIKTSQAVYQQSFQQIAQNVPTVRVSDTVAGSVSTQLAQKASLEQAQAGIAVQSVAQVQQMVVQVQTQLSTLQAWAIGTKDFAMMQTLSNWVAMFSTQGSNISGLPNVSQFLQDSQSMLSRFQRDSKTITDTLNKLASGLAKCMKPDAVYTYDLATGDVHPPEYAQCFITAGLAPLFKKSIEGSGAAGDFARRIPYLGAIVSGASKALPFVTLMAPFIEPTLAGERKKPMGDRNSYWFGLKFFLELVCSMENPLSSVCSTFGESGIPRTTVANRFNIRTLVFTLGVESLSNPVMKQFLLEAVSGNVSLDTAANLVNLENKEKLGGSYWDTAQKVKELVKALSESNAVKSVLLGDRESSHIRMAWDEFAEIRIAQGKDLVGDLDQN